MPGKRENDPAKTKEEGRREREKKTLFLFKKLKVSTVRQMPSQLYPADSHLSLNPTKTMAVSTSQMSRVHSLGQFNPSLRISNRSLKRVNLTKLLGIHFSEHLSLCTNYQSPVTLTENFKTLQS